MTAHRTLQDAGLADREVIDPGEAGAIDVDKSPAHLTIYGGDAETRTINAPTNFGIEFVLAKRDTGNTVILTQASGDDFNVAGADTITLTGAGAFAKMVSISVAGVLMWRYIGGNGAVLS